ncbi:histone-lysine n-methyltransferase [Grosmannia clavigera kw1407]|uniref:Histone-lysine n-methyltransferase n=1 Tax=Grosmannia clavigera (strain kw1407 / UAMH 11150) TaxID=655863 RepID=F0X8L9_GROCL|nr:histone-lysine n-methyltransferase [Grosmannia clavigera kw1407]EFX06111.1 histone-lysine n-methyltransferase [Grosmannia clavigera kw1407]
MASEAEPVSDAASRGPPHGVKVTPIPPPHIPFPTAASSTAAATATSIAAPTVASPMALAAVSDDGSPAETAVPPQSLLSTIPQKRALGDEDHTPAVRSPLNPDSRATPDVSVVAPAREKRTKKDSLKKRESKSSEASRATPEPRRKENSSGAGGGGGSGSIHSSGAEVVDGSTPSDGLPVRVRLAVPLRPSDFDQPASPIFRSHHSAEVASGQEVEFFELFTEQPINRRGYVYESGIADPRFPSINYFRQTEPKPHYAHFCFEDAPAGMFFDQSGLQVNGDAGFRTTRANVAARQGRWYWECKVTRGIVRQAKAGEPDARGHVRMGWARREASRDAPVGYDAYGYGVRDRKGQKMHMSRPKDCFLDDEDIREGDVIGLEIQLPSEALHRKTDGRNGDTAEGPNVLRDRNPFRFQTSKLVFEKFDYLPIKELEDLANAAPTLSTSSAGAIEPPNPNHAVPCLRTLPGSFVRVYKNGVLQGTPFTNLLSFLPPASSTNAKMQEGARERLDDGTLGYYPAVSTFRGGAVEVNFGPHFWYPPPELEAAAADDVMMVDVGGGSSSDDVADRGSGLLAPSSLTKLRPVADRYEEQIAEDIVYDLVDEVYFWVLDGCKAEAGGGDAPAGDVNEDMSMDEGISV